jgi:oligopeptide/dipeptide ABC transporter ATP-binding protein
MGTDLLSLDEKAMRAVRGAGIGAVFQDPGAALNPVLRVGDQIAEALVSHGLANWRQARGRAVELLEAVRIAEPGRTAREYPHRLSGGMRQRVMIAIALACKPAVIIADEPTSALDVTVQAATLDLLRDVRDRYGLALLLITHDLGVVAEAADRVAVIYGGHIVEQARARELFTTAAHPYTRGLLASFRGRSGGRLIAIEGTVPALGAAPPGCPFEPRCEERLPICSTTLPDPAALGPDHWVRCFARVPTTAGRKVYPTDTGMMVPADPGDPLTASAGPTDTAALPGRPSTSG